MPETKLKETLELHSPKRGHSTPPHPCEAQARTVSGR